MKEQFRSEKHSDLSSGRRIHEIDAAAPSHRQVDEREGHLIDPAEVDATRPAIVL